MKSRHDNISKKEGATTAKDPVCGMDVDISKAAARSKVDGKDVYFCGAGCRDKYEKQQAGAKGDRQHA